MPMVTGKVGGTKPTALETAWATGSWKTQALNTLNFTDHYMTKHQFTVHIFSSPLAPPNPKSVQMIPL